MFSKNVSGINNLTSINNITATGDIETMNKQDRLRQRNNNMHYLGSLLQHALPIEFLFFQHLIKQLF
jgi:hypothetical protein